MKKIALILAVFMILSTVSVFAAPSVEHMFYDETENKYYVFGTYDKAYINASDVGVYFNGEKFSYVKDDDKTNLNEQNAKETPRFGLSFTSLNGPLKSFSVTPYSVVDTWEKVGSTATYDFEKDKKQVSSNANLKTFSYLRPYDSNSDRTAFHIVYPEWDPENVTAYTLEGMFYSAATNKFNPAGPLNLLHLVPADENANVEIINQADAVFDSGNNVTRVLVTAEDGVTTREYTFRFLYNNTLSKSPRTNYGSIDEGGIGEDLINNDATYTTIRDWNGAARNIYSIYTFDISEAMLNSPTISFLFKCGLNQNNFADYTNFNIVAKGATLKDGYKYDKATLTYNNSVAIGNITIGEEIGRTVIPSFRTKGVFNYICSIDVTDYVKEQINAGKTECSIVLQSGGYDLPLTNPETTYLNMQIYANYSTYTEIPPNLVYKAQ